MRDKKAQRLVHRLARMRLAIDIGFHGRDMVEMQMNGLKRKQRGREDRAVRSIACGGCQIVPKR